MSPALQIQNLSIRYSSKLAVDSLNLELKRGEIFGLLGPNGAGKTSVISAIVGLLSDFEGKISIFGSPSGSPSAKLSVGLVPQELISYGFFSLEEILKFNAGYFGVRKPQSRIEWLLNRLQLWDVRKKKMAELSGGMKRRFLIAKALIHSPQLLLLDEPSAGVDVELREILWQFVRELHSEGITILLTTHYLEEAEQLCERVGVVHLGKLRALDRTQNLVSSIGARRITLSLKTEKTLPRLQESAPILHLQQSGRDVRFQTRYGVNLGDVFSSLQISPAEIVDIKIEEATLEEAFRRIISEKTGEER